MDAHCVKCGALLAPAWSFCPQCGARITHEKHESIHQPVPANGAFSGMYLGLVAAPILIISGVMLCLTGWGVFFGVPFIILGILAPLFGPIVGMGEYLGKCPECGTRIVSVADSKVHECPVCTRNFAIADREVPVAH
jgi:predicted amidophosphoribosyltransferase